MTDEKKPGKLFKPQGFGLIEDIPALLRDRFVVPPFSVLDAMQGYWQNRKQMWLRLGIQSEIGRGENLLKFSDSVRMDGQVYQKNFKSRPKGKIKNPDYYRDGNKPKGKTGYAECMKTRIGDKYGRKELTATSVFDPVLCEISYRWFCPAKGHILDPFAGGSVRGIVASILGLNYTGLDLSKVQVEANRQQAEEICPDNRPTWHVANSLDIKTVAPGKYDMIYSCPPFFDLEVYSDDPNDLSNMTHEGFTEAYSKIIADCVSMLKPDRFACFVVGEVRDQKSGGFYRNLVPLTIWAFENVGAAFYNEIILVTAIGTLPVRINKQFNSGRKIGKTHQNVLVFYKGNPKNIKDIFGEVIV